ncbi:hypothetical protein OH77DRAFT_281361 [Trametes cingulata]|nr:hypothetical protein OH77DRAFT_281361 [Trametes cingulata]
MARGSRKFVTPALRPFAQLRQVRAAGTAERRASSTLREQLASCWRRSRLMPRNYGLCAEVGAREGGRREDWRKEPMKTGRRTQSSRRSIRAERRKAPSNAEVGSYGLRATSERPLLGSGE